MTIVTLLASSAVLFGQGPTSSPRTLSSGNLTVFPLVAGSRAPDTSDYITLDEGLKNKTVTILEVGAERPTPIIRGSRNVQQQQRMNDSGDVNRLLVKNASGKKLLLIAGELVLGGKQDRILEKDTLILPGKEAVDISVYCVEHGRWAPDSRTVGAGGFGGGKAMVQPSVRGAAQHERSQEKVWANVDQTLSRNSVAAPTKAYRLNLESPKVQASVDKIIRDIQNKMPKDAVGAVVAVGPRLVWMDRFASPGLFGQYWPKLLQSYALEAITSGASTGPAPSVADAMKYAQDRSGKSTYEGVENVFRLTKIDGPRDVLYEIQDTSRKPALVLHTCRQQKESASPGMKR